MTAVDDSAEKPKRLTQIQRREAAEQRLLEAAAELISETGTAGLSLSAIGERAGFSRGLATHHFGSKAALMERLVEAVHREFFGAWHDTVGADESLGGIHGLIEVFRITLLDMEPLHRSFLVLWADSAGSAPELRDAMAHSDRIFRDRIRQIIDAGISEGEFSSEADSGTLAVVLAGALRGIALELLVDPDEVDVDKALSQLERMMYRELAP